MPRPQRGPRPKLENPVGLFKRLMKFVLKDYWAAGIVVVVCIVVSVLASVQGTMFTRTLIDDYIVPLIGQQEPDFSGLLAAITRVACFYGVGVAASYAQTRIMVVITQGMLRNFRDAMFVHMESLPIRYFDSHPHGDIMSLYTNDTDTLRQMVSQSIPQLINSAITIVSVLAGMVVLSIPLTAVTLVMVAVMMFASGKAAGLSGSNFVGQQRALGNLNGYIEEMMNGQKVVKVFCREEAVLGEFRRRNDELFESANLANRYANVLGPINAQLGNMSYVLCAMVGGVLALNGWTGLTVGKLASFLTFNRSFNMPVNQISTQFNSIVMALAGAERIFRLLDEEPETDEGYVTLVHARKEGGRLAEAGERTGMWAWKHPHQADQTVTYTELKGDVVFDGVDFGYVPEKTVLHDVKLYATPGQKIAFVGSTGAGKTTITNLINRFYDIQDGKIRYDGININKIKRQTCGIPWGWYCRIPICLPVLSWKTSATGNWTPRTKTSMRRQSWQMPMVLSAVCPRATIRC